MCKVKSVIEINKMRASCNLAARTLEFIAPYIKEGVSTLELNNLCHDFIISKGAYPSTLNYNGFPKSICTSINEVICHGIPKSTDILKNGDIINIDVTVTLDGFHGDSNYTFFVGDVNSKVKKLVEVAYDCMMVGINEVKNGVRLGNIGAAISALADKYSYGVVTDYCGHGIGREFHEDPKVIHKAKYGTGPILRSGMTFTVEPMINMGKSRTRLLSDRWTVVTIDNRMSAQFEHTILVTEQGFEILTENNLGRPSALKKQQKFQQLPISS